MRGIRYSASQKKSRTGRRHKMAKFKPGQSGNPGGRPKIVGEVQELARKTTPMAIKTLERIAGDQKAPPAAQVSAATALLDRAWGRPAQAVDVSVNRKSHDEMTDAELLAIAAGGEEDASTEED